MIAVGLVGAARALRAARTAASLSLLGLAHAAPPTSSHVVLDRAAPCGRRGSRARRSTSRISTSTPPTSGDRAPHHQGLAVGRRPAAAVARRVTRAGSSGSSRKDSSSCPSWRRWGACQGSWEYDRGAGRAHRGPKTEPDMKRPESSRDRRARHSAAAAAPTLHEALPGAPGRGWCWAATAWSGASARAGSAWSGWPGTRSSSARWPSRRSRARTASGGAGRARGARRRPAQPPGHRRPSTSWPTTSTTSTSCRSWFGAEPSPSWCARARSSDRDVARIGAALCDALEHAHARGVIHRDVKPQNVMVVAEPAAGAGFAKLADFGVAHVVSGEPAHAHRRRGRDARVHGARAGRGRAR